MDYILSPDFHQRKREQFRSVLEERNLDAAIIINPVNIGYFTGFWHKSTERPLALVLGTSGSDFAIVPELELEHFKQKAGWLSDIDTFFDYPEGDWHWVGKQIRKHDLHAKRLGIDLANTIMKDPLEVYSALRGAIDQELTNISPPIYRLRMIKEPEEIGIFRTASYFSRYLHEVAWNSLRPGIREYELHQEISTAVIKKMMAEVPDLIDTNGYGHTLISGRTLFGAGSSLPHGPKGATPLEPNSLVMITYGTGVNNYLGETERVGFFGSPSQEEIKAFSIMLEAQDAALEALGPGIPCSEVQRVVDAVFARHGVSSAMKHHTGHGKGLETHEHPYLDRGESTILEPGMVLSVEPGLYYSGRGGYRHSDTVLVTDDGVEILTDFPRDLQSLTVPL